MNAIPILLAFLAPTVHGAASASPPPAVRGAESVEALVTAGRALLAQGRHPDALAKFEAAAAQDPSLKTRQWIYRTWIAQARVNDALNALDELSKTESGPPLDYLYGMAFAQKAKGYIQEGVAGGIIGMAFGDAVAFLQKATRAEPVLYADAFGPLAEAAWYAGDLPVGRAAAEKAVELAPGDGDAWHLLGRVAFSQYTALQADEARAAEAAEAWKAAHAAFTRALACFAASDSNAAPKKGAEAALQLGWLHVWKKEGQEAARRFAEALAVDPAAVDYGALRGSLAPDEFAAALDAAARGYEARYGAESQGDALLLWWLGFARYAAKQYEGAEAAFTRAVAKAPDYTNSWHYVALSRYFRQDYDGAIAAFRTHHGLAPDDAVASIAANKGENLRILSYVVGLKAAKGENLDAAFLSELQTLVEPTNAQYWNNLGLFLRDAGDARGGRGPGRARLAPEELAELMALYERSFAAYSKALELAPDDPNYLNDAAVVLDYNLDRDLERARGWYVKAAELAEKELARTDLDRETRDLRALALRDARNNLKILEAKIERRAREKEKSDAAKKEQGGSGTPPQ